jgi:hypothetical protein
LVKKGRKENEKEEVLEMTKRLNVILNELAIKVIANFFNNEKMNRENYQYWMSFIAKNSEKWVAKFIDNATTATYINS